MGVPGENVSFKDAINDFPNEVKSVKFIPVGKPDPIPIPLHPPEPFTGRVVGVQVDDVYYAARDFPKEEIRDSVKWIFTYTMDMKALRSSSDNDKIFISWVAD